MCFLTDVKTSKPQPKPKVAERNIWVKKTIGYDGHGTHYSLVDENGKEYRWKRGFHYYQVGENSPFGFVGIYDINWEIHEGLHSYNKKQAEYELIHYPSFYRYCKMVDMYIPKGALYFYNKQEGEYVSNELVYPLKSKK